MKNVALIAVFVLECFYTNAQTGYYPMLAQESKWTVRYTEINSSHTVEYDYTIVYIAKEDSFINGKKYKRIFCEDIYHFETNGLRGFLREDTTAKKVYFLAKDSVNEQIIFDFSLQKGDSIFLNFQEYIPPRDYAPQTGWYKVETESMFQVGTSFRKRISLRKDWKTSEAILLEWVEGIGSLSSPLYFQKPTDLAIAVKSKQVQCFYQDGVNVKQFFPGNCTFNFSIYPPVSLHEENIWSAKVLFYQNALYIQNNFPQNTSVAIYSTNGKRVLLGFYPNSQEIQFPLQLPAGIYLYRVINRNETISGKIIVR